MQLRSLWVIYLVISKSKLLLTVNCHCTDLLLVDAFYRYSGGQNLKIDKKFKSTYPFPSWMYFVVLVCVLFLVGVQEVTGRKYVIVDSKKVLSWRDTIFQTRGLFPKSPSNYRTRKLFFVCSANIQNRGFNSFEYNVIELKLIILSFWL